VPCKPVQDRLPAQTLPPFPAVGFGLRGDAQGHASFAVSAPRAGAVAKGAWDQRMQCDCGTASGRIMAEAAVFGFHPCPDLSARRQIDRSPRPVPVMGRSVPLMKAAGAVWAHRTLAIGVDHGVSGDRQGRLLCTMGSLPLLAALADAAAATCRGAEPVPDKTGADAAPFRHARWALPLP